MNYNELERGMRSPAGLKRKNGARYLWKKDGIVYTQNGPDFTNDWVAEAPVLFKEGEEVDTGKIWIDDKPIYRKLLTGTSFTTGGSYGRVPHEIPGIQTLVAASGYVGTPGGAQYATYANYIDPTNFYWYWTAAGNYDYHFWITYTRD